MALHELKVYPGIFRAAKQGLRKLETVDDPDGSYQVGDELLYREFDAAEQKWTGDQVLQRVTIIGRMPGGKALLSLVLVKQTLNTPGNVDLGRSRRDALGGEDL